MGVERRTRDPLLPQRLQQRLLADDGAAGGIEHIGCRPQRAQFALPDQALGRLGQGQTDDQKIE